MISYNEVMLFIKSAFIILSYMISLLFLRNFVTYQSNLFKSYKTLKCLERDTINILVLPLYKRIVYSLFNVAMYTVLSIPFYTVEMDRTYKFIFLLSLLGITYIGDSFIFKYFYIFVFISNPISKILNRYFFRLTIYEDKDIDGTPQFNLNKDLYRGDSLNIILKNYSKIGNISYLCDSSMMLINCGDYSIVVMVTSNLYILLDNMTLNCILYNSGKYSFSNILNLLLSWKVEEHEQNYVIKDTISIKRSLLEKYINSIDVNRKYIKYMHTKDTIEKSIKDLVIDSDMIVVNKKLIRLIVKSYEIKNE